MAETTITTVALVEGNFTGKAITLTEAQYPYNNTNVLKVRVSTHLKFIAMILTNSAQYNPT